MKKYLLLAVFTAMVLVQWYAPGSIIMKYENALKKGVLLKFRTMIYDPHDPFRGRFVRLNFELRHVNMPGSPVPEFQTALLQEAYVLLDQDEKGFARVTGISLQRPQEGLYVRTSVYRYGGNSYHINLPFDRYFMNEEAAPEAERVYNMSNNRLRVRDGDYALVRIYEGTPVIEALYVEGQPIEELLKGAPVATD